MLIMVGSKTCFFLFCFFNEYTSFKCQYLFEHCYFKQNSSCFVGPVNGHEMFWTVLLIIMGFFVVFSSSLLVIIVSLVLL